MQSLFRIILLRLFPFLIVATFIIGTERMINKINRSVVEPGDKGYTLLYIPTGATFTRVFDTLLANNAIRHPEMLKRVMLLKKYDHHIKPGCYKLEAGISAYDLTDKLIRGLQMPVRVRFQHIRKPEELAGKIAAQIEADSLSLIRIMRDKTLLKKYQATPLTLFILTIPNTYEMWWNTSAEQFMEKMAAESARFWKGSRREKAAAIGLTIPEVVALASIVEKETAKNDEKQIIAGVYINRLKKGWPLQADPTLIFAWDDYTIKRVLNRHKEIKSPYNTYLYKGLPPGPICIPSIASIDAVLNYKQHDYYYFCAKEDFSGYHHFATNLPEHNRHAENYRKALKSVENRN